MNAVIIIPAFNPDHRLIELVSRLVEFDNQVIVINDGSDKEADAIFEEIKEECTVLCHRSNRGKGCAIRTGIRYIQEEVWKYDVIGIMDADGQHLPEDMEKVLMHANAHRESLVIGCRCFTGNVPPASRIGNGIMRTAFRVMTGVRVQDTQTGLRAFSKELVPVMLAARGDRYEYEMNVLLRCARHNIPILEVPIHTIYHDKGNSCSHFHKLRDSLQVFGELLKFTGSSLSSFVLDYLLFSLFLLFLPAAGRGIFIGNVAARMLSATYNYYMNCRFVFHTGASWKTAGQYFLLAVGVLLLNNIFLGFYTTALHLPVHPAKILTEGTIFILSWMVQTNGIFKGKEGSEGIS